MKKTATISLKGKDYATVPARIKEFREANPNGLIETKPLIQPDGQVLFTARILKDKSNPSSGEATGHAIGKMSGDKSFEKIETISIGRALAILGYMASGEIASSEEMEEFNKFKMDKHEQQVSETIAKLNECKTLEELKKVYTASPVMNDEDVIARKDELKLTLK
jgi:hypothetical protein